MPSEGVDRGAHESRADRDIEQQAADIVRPSALSQSVYDRQLLNEMRLNKVISDLNRILLDYDQERLSVSNPPGLTHRQAEVMANLACITNDGSRHEPQFRLGEKNVSVQVRSLLNYGLIELRDGRLMKVEPTENSRRTPALDTSIVDSLRSLLSDDAKP